MEEFYRIFVGISTDSCKNPVKFMRSNGSPLVLASNPIKLLVL